jgi:hypothetical protein
MSAPLELRHIDILARDVLDRRVACFTEIQRIAAVGQYRAADRDHDPFGVTLDRDGMIRSWDLDGLRFRVGTFQHGSLL